MTTNAPPGATLIGKPRQVSGAEAHYRFRVYRFDNGVYFERALVLTPGFVARVDVATWPELRDVGYGGLAEMAARSVALHSP